jgi:hypothetical protein
MMAEERLPQPEDTAITSRLTPDGWALTCGAPGCDTILAGVAWIDINYNMATNVAESQASAPNLLELPAPHLRRYRLGVMFPFDWKWFEETRTWQLEGTRPTEHRPVARVMRIIRGNWNTAELGQLGAPPFFVRCWACGTLQQVAPYRRKGTPPLTSIAEDESTPGAPPAGAVNNLPVRKSLYGAVVNSRTIRRHR